MLELPSFDSLTEIGGSLILVSDDTIVSCQGLNALTVVHGDVEIAYHGSLTTLDGLGALRSIGGDLTVAGNPALPTQEAEALAEQAEVGGAVKIKENLP